jgi:hypothetical protein
MRGVDRSQDRLLELGFSEIELRGAVEAWLRRDPRSAIILVDHDARCAEAALAEIERRYEVFYAEFDHLSAADANALGVDTAGSTHVLAVRTNPRTLDAVIERHGRNVITAFPGPAGVSAASVLFDGARRVTTSRSHARAMRARRRFARRAQAIAGLRALKN